MNKRIKNKVAKRIIKKNLNNKQLTAFEIKYSGMSKDLWNRVVNKKDELDKFPGGFDLAEGPGMTNYSVVEIKIIENIQRATDAMNRFESRINTKSSVAIIAEPSKWNKVKGKVKGWLGK